jgi:hypothetical protein
LSPGDRIPIYVVNQSRYEASIPYPESVILQSEGSRDRHTVKLSQHGILAVDPKMPTNFAGVALPIEASRHDWVGDRLVKPNSARP